MMIPQNKDVRLLVWHLKYVHTEVEVSELYCYNTKGDRSLVVSQVSCRMDVTRYSTASTLLAADMGHFGGLL